MKYSIELTTACNNIDATYAIDEDTVTNYDASING
jgi:hypothetical protein